MRVLKLVATSALLSHAFVFPPVTQDRQEVPLELWEEVSFHHNASSEQIVSVGPKYSENPRLGVGEGWTLWVTVVGDRWAGNLSSGPGQNYLTGAEVTYQSSKFFDRSEPWTTCVGIGLIKSNMEGEPDQNCRGVLTDKCLNALDLLLESSGFCNNTKVPDECKDELTSEGVSTLHSGPESTFQVPVDASLHSLNDFERYDSFVNGIFATMIGTQLRKDEDNSESWVGTKGALNCLKVTLFSEGSRIPKQSKEASQGGEDADDVSPPGGAAPSRSLCLGSVIAFSGAIIMAVLI
jgi:hypothetical protein